MAAKSDEWTDPRSRIMDRGPHPHELYGLRQSHGWGGMTTSVRFTGSARRLLEDRTVALADARHPHGIMYSAFNKKTVVQFHRKLPARALYCEITDLLHGRSIDARQRKSLHRVRDAIVDHVETAKAESKARNNGRAPDFGLDYDVSEPVTTDDPILVKAKRSAGPETRGFRVEQVELTDERPEDL